jgi:uncharacterized protein
MDIKNRLRRLTGGESEAGRPADGRRDLNELRRRIEEIMARRPGGDAPLRAPPLQRGPELHDLVAGREVRNEHGAFFAAREAMDVSRRHGSWPLGEFFPLHMPAAALLAASPALREIDWREGLFLDVETTGLAGGTGTVAFLIGLGWVDGNEFVTYQLFARDFVEERAVLAHLAELAAGKSFLVTFNGKTFDVGLLSTRFIMNRLPDPLAGMPHLDLLHPCRRLYGHRLPNCRLTTLEETLIGLRREDDIPGSEIPQRYFAWLRRRDARLMEGVFRHNRLDVVTLLALASRAACMLSPAARPPEHDPHDLHAAACLCLDRGHHTLAFHLLETLLHSEHRTAVPASRATLALACKRTGRHREAAGLWEAIATDDPGSFRAVEELAKCYEHQLRAYGKAIALVRRALAHGGNLTGPQRESLHYRLERLQRKELRSEGT